MFFSTDCPFFEINLPQIVRFAEKRATKRRTICGIPLYLKSDETRTGFPFELIEPIGEGGFATVYRGKFHQGEAAFKFIPIDLDGYKYDWNSVGIYEYRNQEKINKINNLINFVFLLIK